MHGGWVAIAVAVVISGQVWARDTGECARTLVDPSPRFFVRALKDGPPPSELKIATLNTAGLQGLDGDEAQFPGGKDQAAFVRSIASADPDILWLEEVESYQALADFAARALGGRYRPLLIASAWDHDGERRPSELGVLVRRDLPFDLELRSQRDYQRGFRGGEEPLFTRDLPVLALFPARSTLGSKPYLVIGGVHFKSRVSRVGDPESNARRADEVRGALAIRQAYLRKYGSTLPFLLAGDFNASLHDAPEFAPLWKTGFRDSLDLIPSAPSGLARATHSRHPDGHSQYSQLDGILINGAGRRSLITAARVVPYFDVNGNEKLKPASWEARAEDPSDHFLVTATLNFAALTH